MTSSEIATTVRAKVLETSTEIISDVKLYLYMNMAYKDVYKQLFPNASITSTTVTCTAGVCTIPATLGTLYGSAYDAANNEYEEVSIMDFDRGEFDRAVTLENGTLKVSPNTVASLDIKYYPKPATLTSSENPSIDDYFHEPIIYGTIYRVQEDLQDETLVQFYQARFKQEMTDRLAIQSGYEENNQRGGTMFSEQRLVSDDSYATF